MSNVSKKVKTGGQKIVDAGNYLDNNYLVEEEKKPYLQLFHLVDTNSLWFFSCFCVHCCPSWLGISESYELNNKLKKTNLISSK